MNEKESPLFRPEAIAGRTSLSLGGVVRIEQSRTLSVLVAFSSVIAASGVAIALIGGYDRKLALSGVLVPLGGILDIYTPEAATISQILVREGELVSTGQPVARLVADRLTDAGQLSALQEQAMRKRARSSQDDFSAVEYQFRQRESQLRLQHDSLVREIGDFADDLKNGQARLDLAEKSLQRFLGLQNAGFVSAAQSQQREEELIDLRLRQKSLERQLEASKRTLTAVRADIASNETEFRRGIARHQNEQVSLEQEAQQTHARSQWSAQAPQPGRVATVNIKQGQFAAAGAAIVTLLPTEEKESELVAHLYADSRSIGLVKRNHPVYVRYTSFPYQKFGLHQASVLDIGTTAINPKDIPPGEADAIFSTSPSKEPLYRVRVRLPSQEITDGRDKYELKSGMQVSATVRLERRALWEWLFEPLLSLKSSLAT